MTVVEQAQAFLEAHQDLSNADLYEAVKALPKDVQHAFWELRKASYFVPENAQLDHRREYLSPSGRFKLTVTPLSDVSWKLGLHSRARLRCGLRHSSS